MNIQEHLLYITRVKVEDIHSPKIRGVTAFWRDKDNTACISFYFDGEISEKEQEDASDACTEIIAHIPESFMEENYFRWDYPKPLPKEYLAFKREEK